MCAFLPLHNQQPLGMLQRSCGQGVFVSGCVCVSEQQEQNVVLIHRCHDCLLSPQLLIPARVSSFFICLEDTVNSHTLSMTAYLRLRQAASLILADLGGSPDYTVYWRS